MFADIRSFTGLAERMTPEETFAFVNSFLRKVAPVIRANGGFIDKYLGDGIMAVFPDAPARAADAARGMQEAMARFNEERAVEGRRRISTRPGTASVASIFTPPLKGLSAF